MPYQKHEDTFPPGPFLLWGFPRVERYSEQSAAATGLYVKASADFTAQLVYTDSDGSSQSKSIQVQISEDAAPTQMYADTGDNGIAFAAQSAGKVRISSLNNE